MLSCQLKAAASGGSPGRGDLVSMSMHSSSDSPLLLLNCSAWTSRAPLDVTLSVDGGEGGRVVRKRGHHARSCALRRRL
eukprot:6988471-Prymnesium_polylepis.1